MATALHFDIDLLFVQPVTDGPVHHNHTEGIKQRTILGNARNEFAYFFIEPSEWTEVFRDSFCIDSVWYTNEADGFTPSPSFMSARPLGKKALNAKTNKAFFPNTSKNLVSHPVACLNSIK